MSLAYRVYCHDCKVRTGFIGTPHFVFKEDEYAFFDFLHNHAGHRIEYADFAKHAIKPCEKCYQPEYCEGDCYKIERST